MSATISHRRLFCFLLPTLCFVSGPLFPMAAAAQSSVASSSSNPGFNLDPPIQPVMNSQISADASTARATNLLLKPWIGKYGGLPPWDLVNPDDFLPAFEIAISEAKNDVNAIAQNPEAATFENTIVALEKSGATLNRVSSMFGVHTSNLNLGTIPDIQRTVNPLLSKHQDSIMQNKSLFARVDAVYQARETADLDLAQRRLVADWHRNFIRRGATLATAEQQRLSEINTQLAGLFTEFNQNVLADEERFTVVTDAEKLQGLPESIIQAMAATVNDQDPNEQIEKFPKEAQSAGQPSEGTAITSRWVINNIRSSMEPVLTYADDRGLREVVWKTYYSRCDNGDERDNKQLITAILKLRAERAKLLGFETHAHWRLEPTMAKTPENAMALMLKVWPKAVQRAREEVADMQQIANAEMLAAGQPAIKIEPWDYRYYAEKVRADKYDFDFNSVKPYLQLEKLREGMMWSASELFGFEFKEVHDVPVFHPDVRVWEVNRHGEPRGLFYFDPYARRGKTSGAWMTGYRDQQNIDQPITPLISNNSNFIPGKKGEPVLISWDDAVTLFHEFGHALHGLCSECKYPSQSGTSVARDYVEFPSQIYEHWLSTPEVLQKFAVHHQTGQPMPPELLEKIEAAAKFNEGFASVEFLASALIDMKLHLAGGVTIDPAEFERETLAELGMPSEIVMRHRTPHFSHIFSSDAYSAGYYSYLWSDALTADAAEVFEEAGSYFDPAVAKSLYDHVLSVGDTIDPADGFRRFRGRDVDTEALLRKKGMGK